jgi:hypothetical protein
MAARGRILALAWMCAIAAAACASEPPPSIPSHQYGEPIDPGAKPDPATCQQLIRSNVAGAMRIRASLTVPGIAADESMVRGVAADPASNIERIGVPLSAAELAALKASAIAIDPWSPISFWVDAGAPERFGGLWLDGGTYVAVVDGDGESLALARCVEPKTADMHYVWATISQAAGQAVQTRIGNDMAGWKARGVQINMTYYDVKTGTVHVGVSAPNPELEAAFREAYGPIVRLEKAGPLVLD